VKTERRQIWRLGCLLASLTFAAFWPVHSNQFVSVDDPQYVLQNPHVSAGLSWVGIAWAFGSGYACNWHPVTWMSHMLDCNLFGLNPAGHHVMSLCFHTLNAMLVFFCLHRITGTVWRSFLVAALFVLHPLRVESVAWVAERKDVLSGFFALLALICYSVFREVRSRPREERESGEKIFGRAPFWYCLTFLSLALGLMSKPMLVTLPFVFLLIDFLAPTSLEGNVVWPARFKKINAPLLFEKIPFFALSVSASVVTFLAQRQGGAVSSTQIVPFSLRIGNAVLAYVQYLSKTLVPVKLSPIYPLADGLSLVPVIAGVFLLMAITAICIWSIKRNPWVALGWFWFVGMLVPTIGIIQVGPQAMADRYTYLPSIGLLIGLVWGSYALLSTFEVKKSLVSLGAAAALIICILGTWTQTGYWKDGVTLYGRAFELCPSNYIACDYLGNALHNAGRDADALALLRESLRLQPHYPEGQYNLGTLLLEKGEVEGAIKHLEMAVQLSPTDANAQQNLGNAFLKAGQIDKARIVLQRAVQLRPDDEGSHLNLGAAWSAQFQWKNAAEEYAKVLKLSPKNAEAEHSLALALVKQGATKEALPHFQRAAELRPADASMRFDLGLACLESDQPETAALVFRQSLSLRDDVWTHYRLACALDRLHQSDEAITHYREALKHSPDFAEAQSALANLLANSGTQN
jgi:tetratricopeptide (TPR) repeat protein